MKNKYNRVLLKLSGEMLAGPQSTGFNLDALKHIALTLKEMRDSKIQVAVVIGGGNIIRGASLNALGMARTPADHMGMLSTIINGIAIQQTLASLDCPSRVFSALECPKVVESYNWRKANQALDNNEIVLFVGGTGNPYFTTDTAAAMRASEIKADILLKATKVNGIYDSDPLKNPAAKQYKTITYTEILSNDLKIMDATSIALCRSNHIPIYVFNMKLLETNKLSQVINEQITGTLVLQD